MHRCQQIAGQLSRSSHRTLTSASTSSSSSAHYSSEEKEDSDADFEAEAYDVRAHRANGRVVRNWAQTFSCKPKYIHRPTSERDIRLILAFARQFGQKVKVTGPIRHSPSDIAMTSDHSVDLSNFNRVLHVDREKCLVTVESGIELGDLVQHLLAHKLAFPNLGSIMEQSIGGLLATATHGTGAGFGNFPSLVTELELMKSDGKVVRCARNGENADLFSAAVVGLGCVGIILRCTFKVEPAFRLHSVQVPRKLSDVFDELPELIKSAEHFRFWWFPHTDMTVTWSANRTDKPAIPEPQTPRKWFWERLVAYHSFESALLVGKLVPRLIPSLNRGYRKLLFDSRSERIEESHKIFTFDCLFLQYVNEWAIPIDRCQEALSRIEKMIARKNLKVHLPVEVRFVAPDDAWLSPCYERPSCYIGVIMYRPFKFDVAFREYFNEYEKIMYSLGGRPHWAKEFSLTSHHFRRMYPRFDDWLRKRAEVDPHNMFVNDYAIRTLLS